MTIRSFAIPSQTYLVRPVLQRKRSDQTEFMRAKRPDISACLILDVELPGLSGLDLQTELATSGIEVPIIFLTGHGDVPKTVRGAMKAGAVEFLTKPFRGQEMVDAVTQALLRDGELRRQRADTLNFRERLGTLTPRERQVFVLVVTGLLNKQIAGKLVAERAPGHPIRSLFGSRN